MIRPDDSVIKALAVAVKHNPELLKWLYEWKMHELEQLPNTLNNPALKQGRCQVLGELYKLASEAPTILAKS
jgi:hypothetical protein